MKIKAKKVKCNILYVSIAHRQTLLFAGNSKHIVYRKRCASVAGLHPASAGCYGFEPVFAPFAGALHWPDFLLFIYK